MSEVLESEIKSFWERGELRGAATCALEGYGPEVLGFLVTTMGSEDHATEAFAQASEDLWRGIDRFRWQCSFRTWLYTLARNASARFYRAPQAKADRRAALSEISEVAVRVRSRTLPHLRTEVKDRFAELRQELERDEQELLILRVDKQLSWTEVARVLSDEDGPSEVEIKRFSAALRKRFQSVKERLHRRAREVGLVPNEDA